MSLSKPSLILLTYVAVISLLLLGYISAAGQQWHPPSDLFGISFAGDLDLWVAGTVMIVGFAAIASGADKVPVCITGSLGTLIALTVMEDPLTRYMTLSALLFSIGVYGMTTSRNAVRVLMSIELMLNAVNINMVAFARYCDPAGIKGQIFAIFILTVAAAEAAVGLAIVLSIYRNSSTVDMEKFNLLKW